MNTKEMTPKEQEFITKVESLRDAKGHIIAWEIYPNGNGRVIFECETMGIGEKRFTKEYTAAIVVVYPDGSIHLDYDRKNYRNPFDRTAYKTKGRALKGFGMVEGRNGVLAAETPQISTIGAEVENVSAEGEKALETAYKSQIEAAIALSEASGESGEVLLKRMERNVAEAPTEELRQIALRRLEIYKN